MKTKIYILSLLGGLLLTMVACLNDGKDDYLDDYESFLCILNSNEQDITFYNTGESAAYNITIDKGGNDLNMLASATLKVLNEFDIEYYNNENKTNFKPLSDINEYSMGDVALYSSNSSFLTVTSQVISSVRAVFNVTGSSYAYSFTPSVIVNGSLKPDSERSKSVYSRSRRSSGIGYHIL